MLAYTPRMHLSAIIIASILWGINAIVAKQLLHDDVSPLVLTALRTWIACGVFVIFWCARRHRTPRARVAWRDSSVVGGLVALGLSLVATNFFYFVALSLVPVAVAIVVQFTAPVWILLAHAVLRKRELTARLTCLTFGCLLSCAVLVGLHHTVWAEVHWFGIGMALASALSLAVYVTIGNRAAQWNLASSEIIVIIYGIATLLWCVVMWRLHLFAQLHIALPWSGILYVALLGTALPESWYLWGLRAVPGVVATLTGMIEPVIATILAAIFLHETLDGWQILGIGGVLTCVTLVNVERRELPPEKEEL